MRCLKSWLKEGNMSLIKGMMVTTSTSLIGELLCCLIAQSIMQKSIEKNLFLYVLVFNSYICLHGRKKKRTHVNQYSSVWAAESGLWKQADFSYEVCPCPLYVLLDPKGWFVVIFYMEERSNTAQYLKSYCSSVLSVDFLVPMNIISSSS